MKAIDLPKKDKKYPAHIICTVAGWGKTGQNKGSSNVLKEATEKLQFSFECKHIWQEYFHSEHMICTKFDKKTEGVCQVRKSKSNHYIQQNTLIMLQTWRKLLFVKNKCDIYFLIYSNKSFCCLFHRVILVDHLSAKRSLWA